jgi:hypothetical protein
MKTKCFTYGLLMACGLLLGSEAEGQTIELKCWNDYLPPLIDQNFPHYPQSLAGVTSEKVLS